MFFFIGGPPIEIIIFKVCQKVKSRRRWESSPSCWLSNLSHKPCACLFENTFLVNVF